MIRLVSPHKGYLHSTKAGEMFQSLSWFRMCRHWHCQNWIIDKKRGGGGFDTMKILNVQRFYKKQGWNPQLDTCFPSVSSLSWSLLCRSRSCKQTLHGKPEGGGNIPSAHRLARLLPCSGWCCDRENKSRDQSECVEHGACWDVRDTKEERWHLVGIMTCHIKDSAAPLCQSGLWTGVEQMLEDSDPLLLEKKEEAKQ